MIDVYVGIGIFVLVYLCYLLFIILNKKKLKKYIGKSKEVLIIKRKYDINFDKINPKLVANLFGLTNGFIIGFVYIMMSLIDSFIVKLIISLGVFIIMTLMAYTMIGKYLKGKEEK